MTRAGWDLLTSGQWAGLGKKRGGAWEEGGTGGLREESIWVRPMEKARGSSWGLNCEKAGEEPWKGVGGAVENLVEVDLREKAEEAELRAELRKLR